MGEVMSFLLTFFLFFYSRTIVNCIQLLTHSIEYSCEQPLLTMIKVRRKRTCFYFY